MAMFLIFFVTFACFSSQFNVPHCFESSSINSDNQVLKMRNPEDFELRFCEVEQKNGFDCITIENMKGESLSCDVSRFPAFDGGLLFAIDCNEQKLGDVYSQPSSQAYACVDIWGCDYWLDDWNVPVCSFCPDVNLLWYGAGSQDLTVRKFFAHYIEGGWIFASATFSYSNLQKVDVRCGRGGVGYAEWEGSFVKTLYFEENPF